MTRLRREKQGLPSELREAVGLLLTNPRAALVEAAPPRIRPVLPALMGFASFPIGLLVTFAIYSELSARNVVIAFAVTSSGALILWAPFLSPSQWRTASRHFGLVSAIAFAMTLPYWWWFSWTLDAPLHSEFYSTVAQILPIILLAVLIDLRRAHSSTLVDVAIYLAIIALGEFWCLFSLAYNVSNSTMVFSFVGASLLAAFSGLAVTVLESSYRDRVDTSPTTSSGEGNAPRPPAQTAKKQPS